MTILRTSCHRDSLQRRGREGTTTTTTTRKMSTQTASSISNEVNKQIVQNRHLHQGGEDQVLEGLVRDLLVSQQQSNRVLVGVTCLTCLTCLLVTCFKK